MKKLISLVLALALVLVSCAVALADGEPDYSTSITINNLVAGDVVKLYKIAAASISASNEIVYDWQGGLTASQFEWDDEGLNGYTKNSDGQLAAFVAYDALKASATYTSEAVATGATSTTISNVAPGYYVAFVVGTENSGAIYQRMIINAVPVANSNNDGTYVAHPAISANAKKEPVTITKTEDASPVDASQVTTTDGYHIGEDINFTLTTSIPSYPSNSTYANFIITDTPNGLKDKASTVEVFINGSTTKTDAGDNTFTVTEDGDGFKVTFKQSFILAHPAESVVVKYKATLTGPVSLEGATYNDATITYNPNPSENTNVTPPGPHDDQNIYGVVVYKYEEGNTNKALQGAEFELYEATVSGETVTLGNKVKDATATNANGLLSWEGLKNGTYAIVETKAPANYRLDSTPHVIELNDVNATGDNPLTADKTEKYFLRSEIPNTPGTSLPETGGIGTTIFYILGGLLVVGAAVILIARRKAQD